MKIDMLSHKSQPTKSRTRRQSQAVHSVEIISKPEKPKKYTKYSNLVDPLSGSDTKTFKHPTLLALQERIVDELVNPRIPGKASKPSILAANRGVQKALAQASSSATMPLPETKLDGRIMIEDDRILEKQGVRYFPLTLAAEVAQVPRTTLLDWISAKVKFQGRALQTYESPTIRNSYLTEESVERLAHRFTKWPSNEPAGEITLGETKDGTGYIGISKAARTIGIDQHTMWLWIRQGNAPTNAPLDLIKCAASDQLYIREKEATKLKKAIPPSGLRRGRRPRQAIQPL
jgi:hypothetical protein